ncbi:MAG: hypothetical protein AAFV53_27820 [Myxococcota bacterium]
MLRTEHVAVTLQNMQHGERAWFWFCHDVETVELPFVLLPLDKDPAATTLTEIVDNIDVPDDASQCVGIAHCDEEGRIHLGSGSAQPGTLPALARWVRSRVGEAPGLARLTNARVIQYDRDRVVTGIWEDPAAWAGVSGLPAGGGLDAAAAALAGIAPGKGGWFWLTPRGPSGTPFLVLVPDDGTRTVHDFAQAAAAAIRRSPRGTPAAQGRLDVLTTGKVVLTTQGSVGLCRTVVAVLAASPGFARLQNGVVLEKSAGPGFAKGRPLGANDVSDEAETIARLAEGKSYFLITPAHRSALVSVRVTENQQAIKDAVDKTRAPHKAFGRIGVRNGRVYLRARESYDGALADLAAWVRMYHLAQPALRALKGAVLDDGDHTHEDDALWTFLNDGGQ